MLDDIVACGWLVREPLNGTLSLSFDVPQIEDDRIRHVM